MKLLELNRKNQEKKNETEAVAEKGIKCAKQESGDRGRRHQAGQNRTFYQYKHELPQRQVMPCANVLVDVLQNPLSQEAKEKKRKGESETRRIVSKALQVTTSHPSLSP